VKERTPRDENSGVQVGLVMTVSLFLILLTFFVLLNSISVLDEKKARLAIGSLAGAFGSFQGGVSPLSGGGTIHNTAATIEEGEELKDILEGMEEKMVGMVNIESHDDGEVITIQEEALFDRERFGLMASSYPLLDRLCTFLRGKDYPVEIVGHTDNTAAEQKGFASNWELSTLMAIQVTKYFVKKGMIPPQRLTPRGCSSYEPIVSHDTRLSRAQNRRVEIIIHSKMPPYVKRIYRKKRLGIFTYKKFDFKLF
jgi:chemotaxis protein MotB